MSQTAHRPLEASKDAHEAWLKASCAVLEDLKHENVLAYVSDYFLITFIRHWGAYSRIKEKKGNDSHLICLQLINAGSMKRPQFPPFSSPDPLAIRPHALKRGDTGNNNGGNQAQNY